MANVPGPSFDPAPEARHAPLHIVPKCIDPPELHKQVICKGHKSHKNVAGVSLCTLVSAGFF